MEKLKVTWGRQIATQILGEKGLLVADVASGPGCPRLSRLRIERLGSALTCAVKVGFHAGRYGDRISFRRNADGSWPGLSGVDLVIHVCQGQSAPNEIAVFAYEQQTVLDAFLANHRAKSARGMGHIPHWLSPRGEAGWRMAGSGFQHKALWFHAVPIGKIRALAGENSNSISARQAPL